MKKLVQINKYNKKAKEKIREAAAKGELNAYIKHPETGEPLKVPPELIRKMKSGETVTIQDIINYQHH